MSGPFLKRSYMEMSSWISNPRWFPVWTEQFPVWFERRQLLEVPGHPELSNHCFPRSHSRHPKFKQSATGKTQSKLFWEAGAAVTISSGSTALRLRNRNNYFKLFTLL